jgi:hypothetical protein
MSQDFIEFLQNHLLALWSICLGWVLVVFTFKYFWHRAKGRFPADPPAGSLIFSESFASGRSLRSWWTRLGGASNCLKVMLTRERLVIRPFFPFLVLGPDLDLVHHIPLTNIETVTKNTGLLKSGLRLRFRLHNGEMRELEILSKKPAELERVLESSLRQVS